MISSKNVFFTADQHFGHNNISVYADRPFKNTAEMDNYMIWKWNEVVGRGDVVYVLGDFIWRSGEYADAIINQLHGNIYLLRGDHDRATGHKKITMLGHIHELILGSQVFILCHWPFRSWRRQHYGSINLHGHSHCRGEELVNQLDVGVDGHELAPWSLYEIQAVLVKGEANGKETLG